MTLRDNQIKIIAIASWQHDCCRSHRELSGKGFISVVGPGTGRNDKIKTLCRNRARKKKTGINPHPVEEIRQDFRYPTLKINSFNLIRTVKMSGEGNRLIDMPWLAVA